LAKFKKKKSQPTPEPNDSKKEPHNEQKDIPETESVDSKQSDLPPSEPIVNQTEKSEKDKKLNKLFWLRVGFAVIAGTAATLLFNNIADMEEKRWTSIGFMIAVFFVTILIAKGMKIQLPSSDRKKIVTQGIGSYIFIYLFIWVLTNTIIYGSTTVTGIPSPIP
jgi:cell division protein FtsW (lipid II flippase)